MSQDHPTAQSAPPWRLDKTLNAGHLLTTIALAMGLLAYANGMDKRVAVLEEKSATQARTNEQTSATVRDLAQDMKQELRSIRDLLMQMMQEKSR